MMILPVVVDHVCLAVAFIAPVYVVWRSSRWQFTIPLGAFIFWFTLLIAGPIISALDPLRDAAMLDTIWFFFGWILGLFYAWVLYMIRRAFLRKKPSTSTP